MSKSAQQIQKIISGKRKHRMTTLASRIEREMQRCGLTQEELADKAGVSQSLIHKLKSGKAKESRKISNIAAALGVNTDWLATGRGEKFPRGRESNVEEAPDLGEFSQVPIVGTAQLGNNGHWSELEYPVGFGDGYIPYPTRDGNAYAVRCVGDSMKPRIKDGEFVIVEPNSTYNPGDEVLIKSVDGRVMVKIYLYTRDARVYLMSINESHPPQSFALEEIDKIHFVGGIVKKALWKTY